MTSIRKLLIELKYELFKNILLNTFLRTTIAYFIFYIIGSVMGLWYGFSVIFAGLYFFVKFTKQMKKINLKQFEEHNPQIRDMLSTAADNINQNNIVVHELFKEVIDNFRRISSGTLIVPKTILIMVLIIPVLAVAGFEMSPLHIDAISQDKIIDNLQKITFIESMFNSTRIEGEIIEEDFLEEDIYGERSVARLGNQEIDVRMNLGFNTDFTRPKDENLEDIQFKDFPDESDLEMIQDTNVLNEYIEESDLARKYNEKIRNIR
jgi:hypothetical protein